MPNLLRTGAMSFAERAVVLAAMLETRQFVARLSLFELGHCCLAYCGIEATRSGPLRSRCSWCYASASAAVDQRELPLAVHCLAAPQSAKISRNIDAAKIQATAHIAPEHAVT
ncbi:MAG: hypothetical protein QM747_07770 [Nocardioides sp.]